MRGGAETPGFFAAASALTSNGDWQLGKPVIMALPP